jgi:hypothetical protein
LQQGPAASKGVAGILREGVKLKPEGVGGVAEKIQVAALKFKRIRRDPNLVLASRNTPSASHRRHRGAKAIFWRPEISSTV